MVSAAKMAANLLQAVTSQIAGKVHTNLTRQCDGLAALLALQIGEANVEMVGNNVDNVADGDVPGCGFELAVKGGLCQFECNFRAGSRRNRVNGGKGAFELSDIGLGFSCDVVCDGLGNVQASKVGFFLDDCDPRIVAGRVDSCYKAPVEPADKTLFEAGDVGWCAVGAEYYLPAIMIERIEGVEEFLLALLALTEKLDIIDDEHINGAELALKAGEVALLNCADESVDEILTAEKLNYHFSVLVFAFFADCVQQVCFTQAGIAIKEKRIVGIAGRLADGDAGCVGEAIARADNEIRKRIIGMQLEPAVSTLSLFSKTCSRRIFKIDSNKMACNLLSGTSKTAAAVIAQELDGGPVGAGNEQQAAVKTGWCKLVEPFACVGRVERFCAFDYISKNFLNRLRRQNIFLPYQRCPQTLPPTSIPAKFINALQYRIEKQHWNLTLLSCFVKGKKYVLKIFACILIWINQANVLKSSPIPISLRLCSQKAYKGMQKWESLLKRHSI